MGPSTMTPHSFRMRRTLPTPGPADHTDFETTYRPRLRLSRSPSEETVRDRHDENDARLRRRRWERSNSSSPPPNFRLVPRSEDNIPLLRSPPSGPSSPDPIGLSDVPAARSSSLPQSPTPRRVFRRPPGPSQSPSRTRTLSLGLPPPSMRAFAQNPPVVPVSPPHSPSRIWLEEYQQQQIRAAGGPQETELDYLHPLWGGPEDMEGLRPSRRRPREDIEQDGRPATRRRHGEHGAERQYVAAPNHGDQPRQQNIERYNDFQRRREARHRDGRRDGLVFDYWSPALPSPTMSAVPGIGGGLFDSDSHLPDGEDLPEHLPSRRHVLPRHDDQSFIDFTGPPRHLSTHLGDTWDEVDDGMLAPFDYII